MGADDIRRAVAAWQATQQGVKDAILKEEIEAVVRAEEAGLVVPPTIEPLLTPIAPGAGSTTALTDAAATAEATAPETGLEDTEQEG